MRNPLRAAGPAIMLAILLSLLCAPVSAQSAAAAINGAYVLMEEGTGPDGLPAVGLAILKFSENGSVIGVKVSRAKNTLIHRDVQGTYTLDGNGGGILVLNAGYSDEEGNSLCVNETYKLVITNDQIKAVRTCPGYFSVAVISKATPNNLAGTYSFAESIVGKAVARVVQLKFNSAGSAEGYQTSKQDAIAMKASAQNQPDGFGALTLTTNIEGEDVQSVIENYVFLSTASGVWMMRTDNGASTIVTLTR